MKPFGQRRSAIASQEPKHTPQALPPNDNQAKELIQRVHDFPPELFNIIQEHVFKPFPRAVRIDKNYRSPSELQVSRDTRQIFARRYYSQTTFVANGWDIHSLRDWALSVSPQHTLLIKHIDVRIPHPGQITPMRIASGARILNLMSLLQNHIRCHDPDNDDQNIWWLTYSDGTVDSLNSCRDWWLEEVI